MRISSNRWNRLRYGFYAPFYEVGVGLLDRGRCRSFELLRLQPGGRVLIVGTGTGRNFPLLPPGLDVTAVDLSPAMLEKAKARGVFKVVVARRIQ